jgi:hypothetical protein
MLDRRPICVTLGLAIVLLTSDGPAGQQEQPPLQRPPDAQRTFSPPSAYVPDLTELAATTSGLRDVVDRFSADAQALSRFYTIPGSDERRAKARAYLNAWLASLPKIPFARLSREGQVDYILLRNYIEYQLALLRREERTEKETSPLVPFAEEIIALQERRQKLEFISADAAAAALAPIVESVRRIRTADVVGTATALNAMRASQEIERLRGALEPGCAAPRPRRPRLRARDAAAAAGEAEAVAPRRCPPATRSSAIRSAARGCSRIWPAS